MATKKQITKLKKAHPDADEAALRAGLDAPGVTEEQAVAIAKLEGAEAIRAFASIRPQ